MSRRQSPGRRAYDPLDLDGRLRVVELERVRDSERLETHDQVLGDIRAHLRELTGELAQFRNTVSDRFVAFDSKVTKGAILLCLSVFASGGVAEAIKSLVG